VEYGNVEFKSDNRGTFLTLKSAALKKNDQIKALEFHTQEYQSHYEKLNKYSTSKINFFRKASSSRVHGSKINATVKYCFNRVNFTIKFCTIKDNIFVKCCMIKTSFFIEL
jgi:hypothetical protein